MNLKEQQYIVTLANYGNMTQAAKKLGVTQPALSSYLSSVENGLGFPLERSIWRRPEKSWRWGRNSSSRWDRSSAAIRDGFGWVCPSAGRRS